MARNYAKAERNPFAGGIQKIKLPRNSAYMLGLKWASICVQINEGTKQGRERKRWRKTEFVAGTLGPRIRIKMCTGYSGKTEVEPVSSRAHSGDLGAANSRGQQGTLFVYDVTYNRCTSRVLLLQSTAGLFCVLFLSLLQHDPESSSKAARRRVVVACSLYSLLRHFRWPSRRMWVKLILHSRRLYK